MRKRQFQHRHRHRSARVQSTNDDYEDRIELWVLRGIASLGLHRRMLKGLSWFDDDLRRLLNLDDATLGEDPKPPPLGRVDARLRKMIQKLIRESRQPAAILDNNVTTLGQMLGLNSTERQVLGFAILLQHSPLLQAFFQATGIRCTTTLCRTIGAMLDSKSQAIERALAKSSLLSSCGLVKYSDEANWGLTEPLEVLDAAKAALMRRQDDHDTLLSHFFDQIPKPVLTIEQFDYLASHVQIASRLLRSALAKSMRGVNILLFGPPGTGKTELARLLCSHSGGVAHAVCTQDDDGDALSGERRFGAYAFAQKLLRNTDSAVVIFDELEDVFPDVRSLLLGQIKESGKNKGWTNRLLEDNRVPTIWVGNEVEQMDTAFVRRFTFVMEMKRPSARVRGRVLREAMDGLPVASGWIEEIARDHRLSPGVITSAARLSGVVEPCGGDAAQLVFEQAVTGVMRAQGLPARVTRYVRSTRTYDLGYLNTSTDLGQVSRSLAKLHSPGATICLYGPPGCGKTAYVHHLADELDYPIVSRRASDLLGKFVGETEQRIAEMFEEAKADNALLLLDEADTFLRDRRNARASWEISQVNEILVQMEVFDGIFFCSTNLMEEIDQAALRRFALKVRFDFLQRDQRRRLFGATLSELGGVGACPDGLNQLDALTPGDFAAVARQARLLRIVPDSEWLMTALREEHKAKRGARSRPMGFGC